MDPEDIPVEKFAALSRLRGVVHFFVGRAPGLEVAHDKEEALRRLEGLHIAVRDAHGLDKASFVTAEQIHGNGVAVVDEPGANICMSQVDGLITDRPGIALGIYVADCCAVYLVDPVRRAIGLVHSGRKGTELNIVGEAISMMRSRFGTAPGDLIVQLSPCIRPPHYEIDFAREIMRQARAEGVSEVHDCGTCTASDLGRYYSYRAERGKTGRMLALLALRVA